MILDKKEFSEPKDLENRMKNCDFDKNHYENIVLSSKPYKNLLKLYEELVKNDRIYHILFDF